MLDEFTGERLLPDQQRGELIHAEHLARYRFAARLALGLRILDAACGEGYGTAMLASAGAEHAVGVDLDAPTIEHARAKYGLSFERADVSELPFEDDSFDLVVSFETLEHVDDAASALVQFERVLAPGGVLVASTPNSERYMRDNEFHTREFTPSEFAELLGERFGAVRFYYQQDWLVSAVLDEQQFEAASGDAPLSLDLTKVSEHQPGDQLFTVAICGQLSADVRATGVASAIFEAQRMLKWVERALRAETERKEWQRLHDEWKARATEAERLLDEARATLERIESSASWKLTQPLRSAKHRLTRE